MSVPLTGGSIVVTAAGPVALIRAHTDGREQVVLRATLPQLAELIDAFIARRSAMAKARDRQRDREEGARPRRRARVAVETDEEVDAPLAMQTRPKAQRPSFPTPAYRPPPRIEARPGPGAAEAVGTAPAVEPVRRTCVKPPADVIAAARARLPELVAKGWKDGAIADEVGVSRVSVRKWRLAMPAVEVRP